MANECEFLIDYNSYKKEHKLQSNALRIESFFGTNRCTLKPPKNFPENRIETLLINGDIEYFGFCEYPCPNKK